MKNDLISLLLGLVVSSFSCIAKADVIQVVNEDFEEPFTGYFTYINVVGNATATMGFGDFNGSNGAVFGGTWTIAATTSAGSGGILAPLVPPTTPFHVDPVVHEGISSIQYSADVKLNGFSGDDLGNLFIQLLIYQNYADGSLGVFAQTTTTIVLAETTHVNIALKRTEFQDYMGKHPDLSPDAKPLSFGLQLGAKFDDTAFIGSRQGHLRADNWIVNVTVPDLLFEDGYE